MVVAGGPTPIWHQDIFNRHGEIGQLHIYRYANSLYGIISHHFLLFCDWFIVCNDCNAVYSRLMLFL